MANNKKEKERKVRCSRIILQVVMHAKKTVKCLAGPNNIQVLKALKVQMMP